MKFKKKPVVIEAEQWFPVFRKVVPLDTIIQTEGASLCSQCGLAKRLHGWIDTLEGGHIVCPGDWIVTGVKDENYPIKPDILALTYEKQND